MEVGHNKKYRLKAWFNYQLTAMTFLFVAIAGCSPLTVDHASGRTPSFVPEEYFKGKICADGVVRDRSGAEIRSFNAQILASWDEQGVGTLAEIFYFNEGLDEAGQPQPFGRETRVWTLTPELMGQKKAYRARATDVPEPGLMTYSGNAVHMGYVLQYGEPGDTIALDMDDWMFKVSDDVVVNETKMSKFGIHVGQVLLVMRKVSDEVSCLPE